MTRLYNATIFFAPGKVLADTQPIKPPSASQTVLLRGGGGGGGGGVLYAQHTIVSIISDSSMIQIFFLNNINLAELFII